MTVQQTGVRVNVTLWRQKKRSSPEAAQKKQFVSAQNQQQSRDPDIRLLVSYRGGKKLLTDSSFTLFTLILTETSDVSSQRPEPRDLRGCCGTAGSDLTSWTRPVRQDLHAGDARQLHLEVALAVQEQISAVHNTNGLDWGSRWTLCPRGHHARAWPRAQIPQQVFAAAAELKFLSGSWK